ncbi:MAG: acetyltransferase [Bryobacterales bacterium]|jgi:hypothetical protein|nr:acetyltransferase [Bryobacterales bacterium]
MLGPSDICRIPNLRRGLLLLLWGLFSVGLSGQDMLTPAEYTGVNIPLSDLAIFEADLPRDDLRCKVERTETVLGFDLNYHTGYHAEVPLAELLEGENILSVLFRVYPVDQPKQKRYFIQRFRVPDLKIGEDDEPPKGSVMLQGGVLAGTGKYRLEWLMRDRRERVCASSWEFEVIPDTSALLPITLTPGLVRQAVAHPFKNVQQVDVPKAESDASLHVKVLVHFAPLNVQSAALQPIDLAALSSILRSISQDERVGKVSLVVFNVREQRVLYRQDASTEVDYPAIGEAIDTLNQGTIRYSLLADRHSDTRFLTQLITSEIARDSDVDGVIFVGPKVMLEENPPKELLGEVGAVEYPLFYVNYNLNPRENPFRDAIGHAVRFYRGQEFTVFRPQDLFSVVRKMFTEIEGYKSKKLLANMGTR